MNQSTLRAEGQEFKPHASSLRANFSEFEPSRDLALVSRKLTELVTVTQSMSILSLIQPFQPCRAVFAISQSQYLPKIKFDSLGLSKVVPATEFHIFPKLPAELRFKIWILSLPGPRVVELHYNALTSRAVSSTPAPAALHTSRESHEEALKQYSLLFEDSVLNATVYIDVSIDTLSLPPPRGAPTKPTFWGWKGYLPKNKQERSVHLAVSFGTFYKISVDNGDLGLGGGVLSKLQRLLTFSVVIGDIDHTRATNSTLLDIPWNGCTRVRELEKESYAGNGGVSGVLEEYYPCSECRQICHQLCSRNRCNRSWHREPCEGFCDAEEGWRTPVAMVKLLVSDAKENGQRYIFNGKFPQRNMP
ncbi:hypothetical protein BKA61DRAFT_707737 [Leptodontidium sp. MPI-SDFR-AT-0119]|nr:hypothetical protein BKA61DRAFT_707737 [Leptodontidium sp. MPI-SDFR-AT-0119]